MSEGVWMCSSQKELHLWAKVTNDWRSKETRQRMIELTRRNAQGEILARDAFPPQIYGERNARESDYKFTDLFLANALVVVSERLAAVLRRFELGNASLYTVPVFKKDQQTPVEGGWFFLNYGNVKRVFVPEQTPDAERIGSTEYWTMPGFPKAGDVALTSDALSGPDIWVDPRCSQVFFLSDRLVSAIKAEKLSGFGLVQCKIV